MNPTSVLLKKQSTPKPTVQLRQASRNLFNPFVFRKTSSIKPNAKRSRQVAQVEIKRNVINLDGDDDDEERSPGPRYPVPEGMEVIDIEDYEAELEARANA